jgi:hypothetical protein
MLQERAQYTRQWKCIGLTHFGLKVYTNHVADMRERERGEMD